MGSYLIKKLALHKVIVVSRNCCHLPNRGQFMELLLFNKNRCHPNSPIAIYLTEFIILMIVNECIIL